MTFWKPGTVAPGSEELAEKTSALDRENEAESNVTQTYNPNAKLSIQQQKLRLPIFQCKTQILYLIETYQVVVIVGETGCGKTTQIPQYLHEAKWTGEGKIIGCTQPRRIAATSVAARVAEEMGVPLGTVVGYTIRFDDNSDPERTKIKYMTDGMLIREMMLDPLLSKYSVIMVDEAHERSLYTDIILGLLKKILRKRKDLRLIVSSATIDAEDVKNYFSTNQTDDPSKDNVYIMSVEGRLFPVDIHYSFDPVADYRKAAVNTVMDIHKFEGVGDILIFLTGQEEIDEVVSNIKERASDVEYKGTMRLRVMPLYSGLTFEKQMQIFEPAPKGTRKVIVSTNLAETSVTIEGIVYVIDSGFVKIRTYNPRLGIETLVVTPISQATAKQRAGRAGRVRGGKCYRLYTEEGYNKLLKSPIPEMQRSNMATVVLQLKALGIDDIAHFDFVSSPPSENMIRALEILYSLGALDGQGKLTQPTGVTMAEFPVDPFLAKMLIASGHEYGCSEEILSIASMLSIQNIFSQSTDHRIAADVAKRRVSVYEGDHLTLLNVYNKFIKAGKSVEWCKVNHLNYKGLLRAVDIRNQLRRYLKRFQIPIVSCDGDHFKIRKAILSGYFANVAAVLPDGTYKTIRGGQILFVHPTSVLFNRTPDFVVFHEIVQTAKLFMREATIIDPVWLTQIASHFYDFNPASKQHDEQNRLAASGDNKGEPPTKKIRNYSVF